MLCKILISVLLAGCGFNPYAGLEKLKEIFYSVVWACGSIVEVYLPI
jgi:hypothetical protein